MPDKKLTDKEIVKALEICSKYTDVRNCENCPLKPNCDVNVLETLSLDLINRLQAENKRLKAPTTDWLVRGISPEQLEQEKIQVWKAEAYKEFAEKLHEELRMYGIKDKFNKSVFLNVVDKAKKELVDNNEK